MNAAREIYIKHHEFVASVEKHLEALGWACDECNLWSCGEYNELTATQACDVSIRANIGEIMKSMNRGFL